MISKLENINPYLYAGKSIKSEYIFKEIISFLDKKTLFNIINYNKQWQYFLKINIDDYKKLSGKYKIGKKNGIVKLYKLNTNILLFEGEYLNGKRNGNGKEYYYKSKLIFEEEYLLGKRHFKGKEYHEEIKLKFEGEYLFGEKWNGNEYNNDNIIYSLKNGKGFIKEYDYYGNLIFEGEYLNGKRNGKGKEYYDNGELKFEGEYLYDETRKGKLYIIPFHLFPFKYSPSNFILP